MVQIKTEFLLDKKKKFVPLPTRCHFPPVTDFAQDYFCPTIHPNLAEVTCHICKLTFPNKTQKLQHKRAAHKYQREIVEQCNLELEIHSQEILQNIYCIEDHQPSSKEYLCKLKNNETDWVTIIDDTNPHVIQYFNQQEENITQHCFFSGV